MATQKEPAQKTVNRVIKRYSNRKLYDTKDSQYVTLQQIGEMVRRGEDVQIIDNKTKEDKTEVTLALIISEDLKDKPRSVPLGTLRTLIQERGERLLTTLRESSVGKLISGTEEEEGAEGSREGALASEGEGDTQRSTEGEQEAVADQAAPTAAEPEETTSSSAKAKLDELVESTRHTLDQLQTSLDERVHSLLPGASPVRNLERAVEDLTRRVEALEAKLGGEKAEKSD
ncbi:MAG: polyhydroxyalkanoate synthesis regulator DNA-binding domain-containing protein [Deltaproteobacteria bacterium]|nr:polyhydroxyalkanoate synthesis regulator DNA-binding domain-containing protein [Deltaproteobacteria bacterium]